MKTKPKKNEPVDERVHVGEAPPVKTKQDRHGKKTPPGGHYGRTEGEEIWEKAQKREGK